MARGWESKSVEEQMASVMEAPEVAVGDGELSDEDKRLKRLHRAEVDRQIQALKLQRENILSQRTSNPARRTALEAALAQIEGQLSAIG
jgi:hypothetical protein